MLPTGRKIACGVRGVTCGLNWDTGTKKKPSQKIDSVSPNERKTESKAGERRASDRTFWVGTSGDFRYRYGSGGPPAFTESQSVPSFQILQSGRSAMRIPSACDCCGGRALVYAVVTSARFRTRYRRCDCCGSTSKSVSILSSNHVLTTGQASTKLQAFNSHSLER